MMHELGYKLVTDYPIYAKSYLSFGLTEKEIRRLRFVAAE
jgi:hypothetical protein